MANNLSVGANWALAPTGCWTCKDRRVRCDRNLPGCLNCSRVRKACQGYGIRLSWPRDNDPKRAMLGRLPRGRKTMVRSSKLHIIHTSFRDMEMHNHLLDLSTKKMPHPARILPDQLLTPFPSPWRLRPILLDAREAELVPYFVSTAFSSLATFNQNAADLRDLLIQMALSNGTSPSRAVLFALLAVSSQARDGLQSRAVEFKTSAIRELAKSAENGALGTTEAAQHVAAGMLLCTFEIQASSETSGQWLWYIHGVKDIIKANDLDNQTDINFVADLLDWVYYHDVIAQFSILHWRHGPVETVFAKQLGMGARDCIVGGKGPQVAHSARRPSHLILQFLSEIFNVLYQASERRDTVQSLVERLTVLERKANTVEEVLGSSENSLTGASIGATDMTELYQMATMIYLARISESISGELRNMQPLLDDAFAVLCRTRTCELQLPLLILGYEARADEQRIMILNLVRRTEKSKYGRSLDCLRKGLEALWIQEDLVADQGFAPNYMDRLSAIISRPRFIPSLV